ncbi:MAG: DUF6160 family protein [Venatoribacter sp.]
MRFPQKSALTLMIASLSIGAQAGMQALDDDTLSGVTGQAGVTIEVRVTPGSEITVGEVEYTNTDTGGSVVIENTKVSSLNQTQTIDVLTDGRLQMGTEDSLGMEVSVGSVYTLSKADANGDRIQSKALVSDVSLNLDQGGGKTYIGSYAAQKAAAANEGGLGATVLEKWTSAGDVEIDGSTVVIRAPSKIKINSGGLKALDGALEISGLSFNDPTNPDNNWVTNDQTIYAISGDPSQGGGIYIVGGEMKGTLTINDTKIGGSSIGSVAVRNINTSGMVQRIYGH